MIRCAYFVGSKDLKMIETHFLPFYGIWGSKVINFLVTLVISLCLFSCSKHWNAFGSDEKRRIILHYRALYIITTDCNIVFGRIMLPFIKLFVMILFTTCFFLVIRFHDHINFLSLTLVGIIIPVTLLLLIPTTIVMSSLYKTSKTFIRSLTPSIQNSKVANQKEILKRTLISCGILRCEVGGLYYMEAKAKLTVLHKVVNGLKYLLVNVKAWGVPSGIGWSILRAY